MACQHHPARPALLRYYNEADQLWQDTSTVLNVKRWNGPLYVESAYKTGKKFRLYIRAKSAAVSALLPLLYEWLAQFKVLQ